MIDWGERIDGLCDLIGREYAIYDRPVIEMMLAALINCPRTPSVWLILETNWFSRDCTDAWFALGESWLPVPLARLRWRLPRIVEVELTEYLDNASSQERLFIESDERYPRFGNLNNMIYVLQRSLRIRTRSVRSAHPLRTLDRNLR